MRTKLTVGSFKSYLCLFILLLLILPLFTNSVHADTYWAASGNDIYNTNSAEVGIGLDNPSHKLQVKGTSANTTVAIGPSADGYDANLLFLQSTTNKFMLGYGDAAGGFRIHDYGLGSTILFSPEGSGKIGIRTTSPDALLHLGDVYSPGGRNLQIGDDVFFSDIDKSDIVGLYGVSNSTVGALKLGSNGGLIRGDQGKIVVLDNWTDQPSSTGKIQLGWNGGIIEGKSNGDICIGNCD